MYVVQMVKLASDCERSGSKCQQLVGHAMAFLQMGRLGGWESGPVFLMAAKYALPMNRSSLTPPDTHPK